MSTALHGCDLLNGLVGIDLPDSALHGIDDAERSGAGAQDEGRADACDLLVVDVERGLGRLGQGQLLEPLPRRRRSEDVLADSNGRADRIFVRPIALRRCRVNNDNERMVRVVELVEVSPRQERYAHRAEIARARETHRRFRLLAIRRILMSPDGREW